MSQCGYNYDGKEIFGSRNKKCYEPYTDEELESDEFFWNQLKVIVELKDIYYFHHFINARSKYIEKEAGM